MQYNREDENYVYELVSKNIKRIRIEKNLTQRKLAHICNYSEGFIMNIESSYHQTFSLGTIWRISQKLGVDIKELFIENNIQNQEKAKKDNKINV